MPPRGPDFFIIGAPKSGTTALDAYLRAHPDVFMGGKEMHYFSSDLAWGPMFAPLSWEEYLDAFSGATDESRVGETSPSYLYSARALEEIRRYRPDAQIIVALRNPIDMIQSFHSHLLYVGDENITELEGALSAESDRRAGRRIPRSNKATWALLYRDVARCAPYLERYLHAFGRDRLHVIFYDDFARDTAGVYRAMLEFLSVDPDFEPEFEVLNPSKRARVRAISALQETRRLKSVGGWRVLRRAAQLALPSRKARRRLYDWIGRVNTVQERPSAVPPELRNRLQIELAEDVIKLGRLIERDVSHWVDDASESAFSANPG